jgi:hypothetical protein
MVKRVIRIGQSKDRQHNGQKNNQNWSDYSFDHCVVCPLIDQFWLLFWPLCYLSFDLPILITLLTIVLSVLWFTNSDYSFDHCVIGPLIYQFWLLFWPLCYLSFDLPILITLLTIVLSVLYNGQKSNQNWSIKGQTTQWSKE